MDPIVHQFACRDAHSTAFYVLLAKKRDIIMKIFALIVGLGFGLFALAIYAYGLKTRIKELKDKPQIELLYS